MKKIGMFLFVCLMAVSMNAQPAQNSKKDPKQCFAEMMQKRAEQKARKLMLSDADKAWFAPLFVEYQQKLAEARATGKAECKKDCKEGKCQSPTDEQIKKNIELNFDRQAKVLDVKRTYYKKFASRLNAKQLSQLFSPAKMGKKPFRKGRFAKKGGKKQPRRDMRPAMRQPRPKQAPQAAQ